MVTVVSNYCQLSQTQLSQTFAEKFTVTDELLQSLKKTALSGDEESIELLHNIALGYDEFGKKAEDILYHIVINPTNETLSIIRLIKNACLKLYNLAHTATKHPLKSHDSDDLLFKKLFSPSKLMTIIGEDIPLISEKQSLSKVLLNDKNNELSDGTNFWDKNRQLTTDEIFRRSPLVQKILKSIILLVSTSPIPTALTWKSLSMIILRAIHHGRKKSSYSP